MSYLPCRPALYIARWFSSLNSLCWVLLLYSYGYLQVICLSCGGYKLSLRIAICRNYWLHNASSLIYIYHGMFLSLTRFLAPLRSGLSYSGRCRRDARLAQITCTLIRAPTAPPHVHPSATIFDLKCNLADYEFLLCSTYFLLLLVAEGWYDARYTMVWYWIFYIWLYDIWYMIYDAMVYDVPWYDVWCMIYRTVEQTKTLIISR